MRALVTGGAGFVGQWVCRELLERGYAVTGAGPEPALGPATAGGALSEARRGAVQWVRTDVRSTDDLARALDASRPELVVHLAGVSFVPAAQADPGVAFEVNVVGTVRLLEELRRRREAGVLDPVVVVVGSAEQYGRHEAADLPLDEGAEQRPLTVYAASKAAQEVAALQAWRHGGVRLVATRSFNHSGPGQGPHFLLPALVTRALALRARGGAAGRELKIGNGTPVRDFLHVRDVARAYLALAERGTPGTVYNVSSGRGTSVRELAELVLRRLDVDAAVVSDPALVRPADVPALVGDSTRLRRATGWAPERSLEDIIDDLSDAATH